MVAIKLTKVGNSVAAIIPQEVLQRLKVGQGDRLYLTETPDGYRLTIYDPEFEEQMDIARRIMARRRRALQLLAQS
ncbi:AbrB/MazE/SpoVT family DNA-binding domain-containing protein [Xanthobacter tagetidis]|jgi:putative addiction module antidote|uniref:AbrB/MazE/SpoVT family DNA-binding domain-containing protein n=1 Tax=Xanthobacter tagetidis TaxID=60216 RepID=A0A3L7ABK6_9HYPH|nr:AbrB/MazE/SpoVT family DNA-binding domain-containing protein [Xanthobacter tagetidis]MBB6309563.1 putative addiction module antidote [Xanthobacter tagetidis]RLP77118.1 AbrB/MazE/SpoVT family DNA-binding domain-containing protein [Xanthobacter tagetidis]